MKDICWEVKCQELKCGCNNSVEMECSNHLELCRRGRCHSGNCSIQPIIQPAILNSIKTTFKFQFKGSSSHFRVDIADFHSAWPNEAEKRLKIYNVKLVKTEMARGPLKLAQNQTSFWIPSYQTLSCISCSDFEKPLWACGASCVKIKKMGCCWI